jgi:hypothetical protein
MPCIQLEKEEVKEILNDQVNALESAHTIIDLDHDVSVCPLHCFDVSAAKVMIRQLIIKKLSPFVEGY